MKKETSPTRKEKAVKRVKPIIKKRVVSNSDRDQETTTSPWLEDYRDFFEHKLRPVTHAFLDHLGQELLLYAQKSSSLSLEMFFINKYIQPKSGKRWADSYPNFNDSYQMAKMILGDRRERGALTKEFSEKIVLHSLHRYNPEFESDAKFHAKIKQELEVDNNKPQVIIIDKLFEDK